MADSVDYMAERLRKHIAARRVSIMQRMLKGVSHEEYLGLCGQMKEVEALSIEVLEAVKKVNSSEDLDGEDTALLKQLT